MKRYLFPLAGLAAATLSNLAMADNTVDFTVPAYIRDAVSTNTGLELILPYVYINAAKTNASLHFDVYPVASATKLFSTTIHTFILQPAPACAQAVDTGTDGPDPVFVGNFEVQLQTVKRSCSDDGSGGSWQMADTVVYAADVSQAGGATWTKHLDNAKGDLKAVDVTNDGTPEILLATTPYQGGTSTQFQFFDVATGAVVIGPIKRNQGNGI